MILRADLTQVIEDLSLAELGSALSKMKDSKDLPFKEQKLSPATDALAQLLALKALHSTARNFVHCGTSTREVIEDVLQGNPEKAFYFLNKGALRERIALFKENFIPEYKTRRVLYAAKANPEEAVLEGLCEGGLEGLDCASIQEIRSGIAHFHPENLIFNHPVTPKKDIWEAFELGVRRFTIHSRAGLEKILDVAPLHARRDTEVSVRLDVSSTAAEINLSKKFGASRNSAYQLLDEISQAGLQTGLSIHLGSQNTNPYSFVNGIEEMMGIAEGHGRVSSLNIGGGLPVNHLENDSFHLADYFKAINWVVMNKMQPRFASFGEQSQILMEPGRALVAEAVDLTVPVLERNQRATKDCIYIADGVFGSFSDWAVHKWPYRFELIKADRSLPAPKKRPFIIFGQTCDSGDNLGKVFLPENVEPGDQLWVKNAGAYMGSQASRFNGFEPPKYVVYNT